MKKFIIEDIKENIGKITIWLFMLVIQVVVFMKIPVIVQKYIDNMLSKNVSYLFFMVAFYFILNIIAKIINIVTFFWGQNIGWDISNHIRKEIFSIIISYDQFFFNKSSSGKLLEYLERDINILYTFFTEKMLAMIVNFGLLIGILSFFFFKNIILGIIFFTYVLISLFFIYRTIKIDATILNEYKKVQTFNYGKYGEWLENSQDIRTSKAIIYVKSKIKKMNKIYKKVEIKSQKYLYQVWSLTLFLVAIANTLSLFISGQLFFRSIISIGTVYLMYSYSSMLKEPFENLQSQLQGLLNAKVAYDRLNDVIGYEPEVKDGVENFPKTVSEIQFKSVFYRYPENQQDALQDITISIHSREIVGITGASGSGKSTFCKLLCKMVELNKGTIKLNNTDLSKISVKEVRNNIAYVSTSAPIFNDTIKNNLVMYNTEIGEKSIKEILKKYNLLSYFEEMGKDFLNIEIDDKLLSTGQKQIISLSRIFFKKRKIIILDEASSKIDTFVNQIVQEVLLKLKKESSIIIVSHEIETLKLCNKIIYFDNGRIVNTDM